MALQAHIPIFPAEAELVNDRLAVMRQGGRITFFDGSGPIFTCDEHDEGAIRFAAAMLTSPDLRLATPSQIAKVFGRHRSRIHDYRKRYQDNGAEALEVKRRGPRGPSKFKGILVGRAQKLLNEGKSSRKVAELVGINEKTIRNAIKEGRLAQPKKVVGNSLPVPAPEQAPSTPRKRSDVDASCAGGVATKRELERALAPTGLMVEATPQFEPAESVAKAGVIVALPALLGQGLVEVGQQVYGELKNGYYGLSSMLMAFGMMALLRIKSIEGLTNHAPGEFGIVLGLDRVPVGANAQRSLRSRDHGRRSRCPAPVQRAFVQPGAGAPA